MGRRGHSKLSAMLKKRQALIGYLTFQVARWALKRQARKRWARFIEREPARSRHLRLPLLGAAAVAAAALAVVVRRRP
jgi:hypothetical protein